MPGSLLSTPGGIPAGCHQVPGDKSISQRALLLAAAAGGETLIHDFLDSSDCHATARAVRDLGADVEFLANGVVAVRGDGRFVSPAGPLDLGNSGTGLRLLAGLLAGRDVQATLTGDASLRRRPMRRVTQPLVRMGAVLETTGEGTAPLVVRGKTSLRGIDYAMPVASAQVKSAILLAGLAAREAVVIHSPATARDHTERLLQLFGVPVVTAGNTVRMESGSRLRTPGRINVPGDLSSAAFLLAAAAMTPGAVVTITGVGVNPTRTGFLDLLARMGTEVSLANRRDLGSEPVADVTVSGRELHGIAVSATEVALAIDEIPLVLALGALATGETAVHGAAELRLKESDRLAAMAAGLAVLGIDSALGEDSLRVIGGRPRGGRVDSHGDHRIAMAFAVLGQRADAPVAIAGTDNIDTSFPGFASLMRQAGLDITETEA